MQVFEISVISFVEELHFKMQFRFVFFAYFNETDRAGTLVERVRPGYVTIWSLDSLVYHIFRFYPVLNLNHLKISCRSLEFFLLENRIC